MKPILGMIVRLAAITWLLTLAEAGCGSHGADILPDLAAALKSAETVYFAGGPTWDGLSASNSGTKAVRILEGPLYRFIEILGAAGLTLNSPDTVDYVIISARNFRMPSNLGPVLADTLYLIHLRHPDSARFSEKYRCAKCAQVNGEVWEWNALLERGENPVPVFATKIGRVLLVATKPQLLADAASSLTNETDVRDARILIANLSDSRGLWGARLYGAKQYEDQLSAGLRAGNYEVGRDAKRTLFELVDRTSVSVRYYAESGDGGPLRIFEHHGRAVKATRPGVWEADLRLGGEEADLGDAVELVGLFGFGIYI